jgi:hypothetical protein
MFDEMRSKIEDLREDALEGATEELVEIMDQVEKYVLPVAEKLIKVMDKTEAAVKKMDGMITQIEEKLPEEKRTLLATVKEGIMAASKGLQSVSVPLKEKKDLVIELIGKVHDGTWGNEYSDKLDEILNFLVPAKLLRRLSNQLRADMYGVIGDQLQALLAKAKKMATSKVKSMKDKKSSKSGKTEETSKNAAKTGSEVESMPMLRASGNADDGSLPTPLNLNSPPYNPHHRELSPGASTISTETMPMEERGRGRELALNESAVGGSSKTMPTSAMRNNAWVTPEQPEKPQEIDESRISLPNESAPLIQ